MPRHCISAGKRLQGARSIARLAGRLISRRRFPHPLLILTLIAGLGNAPPPSSAHEITIGTGTSANTFPMATARYAARTQAIYLASEIGTQGTITAVALDVSTVPGLALSNWQIRIKHRGEPVFDPVAWDETDLQTAYLNNETVTATGWRTFNLQTPFVYDGARHLLVDFSFQNTATGTNGRCRSTDQGVPRMLTGYVLTLGGQMMGPFSSLSRPNVRLTIGPAVTSVTPWEGENTGPVNITNLAGAHFEEGASVALVGGGGHIHGTGVTVVSPTQITCTFNITGAPPGLYDVVVTNPDGTSGQKSGCFVVNGSSGLLPVEVEGLRAVRTRTGAVAVRWSAAAGVEVAGYRLWRARSAQGPFVRVGGRLITSGARAFQALDAGARGLAHCVYRLDVVSVAGRVIRSFRVTAPPAVRTPAPDRARR